MTELERLRKEWDNDERYATALRLATVFFISHRVPYSKHDVSELMNKSADAAKLLARILYDEGDRIMQGAHGKVAR